MATRESDEGSIPARAGEPLGIRSLKSLGGVYPARAGEPFRPRPTAIAWGVYPRACGGTIPPCPAQGRCSGLSPRVRGNHVASRSSAGMGGSIPARAGEPRQPFRAGLWHRVYPRACGGTNDVFRAGRADGGLSPRVRGNPFLVARRDRPRGSIPARAGEPCAHDGTISSSGVYPRACGGTLPASLFVEPHLGLSPRVRGNRGHYGGVRIADGSIPARAGEPLHRNPLDNMRIVKEPEVLASVVHFLGGGAGRAT